ncbi:hypothetical protein BDW22DRAFT_1353872 [Trametopsis cervina]|nr:hypothetical protein BDW22DRAFT_1353872 [Trametopsis cervina]
MEYSTLDQKVVHRHETSSSTCISTNTKALPQLNFDVLHEVMRQVQRRTLLHMMYTCRALYQSGVPLLLASEIRFNLDWGLRRFYSFYRYVVANVSRCQHLRSLALDLLYANICERTGLIREALLAVAHNASNLESLHITGYIFHLDPRYAEAFGSLKNLKQLRIHQYDATTVPLLSHLKSPLRHLDITFSSSFTESTENGFIEAVKPYYETLETIRASRCSLPDILEPTVAFTHITSLHFRDLLNCDGPFLMKSFPNLRDLSVIGDRNRTEFSPRTIRQKSIAEQLRSKCGWPSLDTFAGSVLWLYAWGIICPIHNLSLEDASCDIHPAFYLDVCKVAKPSQLYIASATGQHMYGIIGGIVPTVRTFKLYTSNLRLPSMENPLRTWQSSVPLTSSLTELTLVFDMYHTENNACQPPFHDGNLSRELADAFHLLQSIQVILNWSRQEHSCIIWEVERLDERVQLHERMTERRECAGVRAPQNACECIRIG